jgi:hypothetical protein
VAVQGKAEQASGGIQAMLEALEAWQEKADALVTTGAFDDEVIATHDSKGCLIELWVRPGLQQELTTDELEDRMNEAISDNAHRARAALMELSDRFLGRFRSIPEEYLHHPTAEQLAGVYSSAREPETTEESN